MTDDPLTTAWKRLRESLDERRDAYAGEGYEVTTATADHGAVRAGGGTGRLVFTVGDDTADAVAAAAADAAVRTTRVGYRDVAGHRLFLLAALAPGDAAALLVAGGVERSALPALAGAETVRTVLRRADGTRVAVVEHADAAPFVEGLDG